MGTAFTSKLPRVSEGHFQSAKTSLKRSVTSDCNDQEFDQTRQIMNMNLSMNQSCVCKTSMATAHPQRFPAVKFPSIIITPSTPERKPSNSSSSRLTTCHLVIDSEVVTHILTVSNVVGEESESYVKHNVTFEELGQQSLDNEVFHSSDKAEQKVTSRLAVLDGAVDQFSNYSSDSFTNKLAESTTVAVSGYEATTHQHLECPSRGECQLAEENVKIGNATITDISFGVIATAASTTTAVSGSCPVATWTVTNVDKLVDMAVTGSESSSAVFVSMETERSEIKHNFMSTDGMSRWSTEEDNAGNSIETSVTREINVHKLEETTAIPTMERSKDAVSLREVRPSVVWRSQIEEDSSLTESDADSLLESHYTAIPGSSKATDYKNSLDRNILASPETNHHGASGIDDSLSSNIDKDIEAVYAIPIPKSQRQLAWLQSRSPIQELEHLKLQQGVEAELPLKPPRSPISNTETTRNEDSGYDTAYAVTINREQDTSHIKKSTTSGALHSLLDDCEYSNIPKHGRYNFFSLNYLSTRSRTNTFTSSKATFVSLETVLRSRRQSLTDMSSTTKTDQQISLEDIISSCSQFEPANVCYRSRTFSDTIQSLSLYSMSFTGPSDMAPYIFNIKEKEDHQVDRSTYSTSIHKKITNGSKEPRSIFKKDKEQTMISNFEGNTISNSSVVTTTGAIISCDVSKSEKWDMVMLESTTGVDELPSAAAVVDREDMESVREKMVLITLEEELIENCDVISNAECRSVLNVVQPFSDVNAEGINIIEGVVSFGSPEKVDNRKPQFNHNSDYDDLDNLTISHNPLRRTAHSPVEDNSYHPRTLECRSTATYDQNRNQSTVAADGVACAHQGEGQVSQSQASSRLEASDTSIQSPQANHNYERPQGQSLPRYATSLTSRLEASDTSIQSPQANHNYERPQGQSLPRYATSLTSRREASDTSIQSPQANHNYERPQGQSLPRYATSLTPRLEASDTSIQSPQANHNYERPQGQSLPRYATSLTSRPVHEATFSSGRSCQESSLNHIPISVTSIVTQHSFSHRYPDVSCSNIPDSLSPTRFESNSSDVSSLGITSPLSVDVFTDFPLDEFHFPAENSPNYFAKLEIVETLTWLQAAGFPQYVQAFQEGQFPVDSGMIEEDHDFLDKDSLKSLFRRLETLNKYAGLSLDTLPCKKGTRDEDEEEYLCALSERWEYQPSSKRWSRRGVVPTAKQAAVMGSDQKEVTSCSGSRDSLLDNDLQSGTDDSPISEPKMSHQLCSQIKGTGTINTHLSELQTTTKLTHKGQGLNGFSNSQTETLTTSKKNKASKNPFRRMDGLKAKKSKRPNVKDISRPIVEDSEIMRARLERMNCVDISPKSETMRSLSLVGPRDSGENFHSSSAESQSRRMVHNSFNNQMSRSALASTTASSPSDFVSTPTVDRCYYPYASTTANQHPLPSGSISTNEHLFNSALNSTNQLTQPLSPASTSFSQRPVLSVSSSISHRPVLSAPTSTYQRPVLSASTSTYQRLLPSALTNQHALPNTPNQLPLPSLTTPNQITSPTLNSTSLTSQTYINPSQTPNRNNQPETTTTERMKSFDEHRNVQKINNDTDLFEIYQTPHGAERFHLMHQNGYTETKGMDTIPSHDGVSSILSCPATTSRLTHRKSLYDNILPSDGMIDRNESCMIFPGIYQSQESDSRGHSKNQDAKKVVSAAQKGLEFRKQQFSRGMNSEYDQHNTRSLSRDGSTLNSTKTNLEQIHRRSAHDRSVTFETSSSSRIIRESTPGSEAGTSSEDSPQSSLRSVSGSSPTKSRGVFNSLSVDSYFEDSGSLDEAPANSILTSSPNEAHSNINSNINSKNSHRTSLKKEYEDLDMILQELYQNIDELTNYIGRERQGHPNPSSNLNSNLGFYAALDLDVETSFSGGEGSMTPESSSEDHDQSRDSSTDGTSNIQRERRDSGVGHSLPRAPSERRRKKIRWHSFQKSHRPALNSRDMQINSLSVCQMVRLQKLSLLRLTSIMEKCLPVSRAGWNWLMPRFLKRQKTPDLCDKSVFGVPLSVMVQRTGQPLPQCVLYAMRYLRRTCPSAVGIFRKSGVKSKIQQLRNVLEAHPETTDFEGMNAYNVADMLKTYFRELPECLLTNKMSDIFRSIYLHVPAGQRLEAIQTAILLLPDENREVVQSILLFLSDIASHQAEHQMNASNLAVCFTPTVFELGPRYAAHHSPKELSRRHVAHHNPKRNNKNAPAVPDPHEILEQKAAHECLLMMIVESKKIFTVSPSLYLQLQGPSLSQLKPGSLPDIDVNSPAEVKAFGQERIQMVLKEAHDKSRGWFHNLTVSDVDVYQRKPSDDCPLKEWKLIVEAEAPPIEVLHRIMHERHMWDEDFLNWSVVDKMDPHFDIFQYVLNSMAPHPCRHFCVLRYWRSDLNKGACALITSSVDAPDEGIEVQGVWAIDLGSYFLIEPCGSGRSRLTYITRVDTRGRAPEWYTRIYAHICANFLDRLRESFKQVTSGPETRI